MKLFKTTNKLLSYIIFIVIFLMLAGLTYSYFVAGLEGVETDTTITAESGYMNIVYDGGPNINVEDLTPSTEAFATKNFTVTGSSDIDIDTLEMGYKIILVVDENTLTENAISYTLTGANLAGNGSRVPSITERQGLGTSNAVLGTGKFQGKITNGVHSYELKIYFYETEEDQSVDMNETFKAHISIENYDPCVAGNCLKDLILGENNANVTTPLTEPGKAISTAEEAVLASAEDDYGTSYYFRGAVTNNYILFADMCWRIVRVTGDGSIKLVLYNYNTGASSCSGTGGTYAFARYSGTTYSTSFNEADNSNAYVGFMYGTPGSATYAAEHANTNKSTILTNLETWYSGNLAPYESQLADTIWCNDKSVDTKYPYGTILGYGSTQTGYSARGRIYANGTSATNAAPTLRCPNDTNGGKLSKFTASDIENGNGALTHKIGLLTIDEVAYAGGRYETANSTYYLNQNANSVSWWSLSPYYMNSAGYAGVCYVNSTGSLGNVSVDSSYGLRPAVSLKYTTLVTGSGTSNDPYIVSAE